jgi:lipopolysaccharide/colanic/teichoic acid biosynthesis glycosyltransferase
MKVNFHSIGEEAALPLARPAGIPWWKRPLDILLVVLSVPIFLPLALLIGVGILIVSPGSIFYAQERVGYRGRRFKCWKFRSMKAGSGDDGMHQKHTAELMRKGQPWQKLDKQDPRVIPLGRLLRATGLDELPQLFNILRGDMSVVGPRPSTPYEFDQYLPWQKERLECLPGLTGLWQVSGKNRTTFVEMVELDIRYVHHPSVMMDLKIIFKTLPTLLEQILGVLQKSGFRSKSQSEHSMNQGRNGRSRVNRSVGREAHQAVNHK